MRDRDGRTYAGATVDLPSLQLTAVAGRGGDGGLVGGTGLEAVVVLSGDATVDEPTSPRSATSPGRRTRAPGRPTAPSSRSSVSAAPVLKERMLAGEPYLAGDPELRADARRARCA